MIYGERIRQVRELHGWTQIEVATHVGVTQPFVAQIESGRERAPDAFMAAYVFKTGFPLKFFETPPAMEFPLGSLLFRAKADMTDREQKSVRTHASMAHEILHRMLAGRSLTATQVRVPHVPNDPEHAAAITRSELGLPPHGPIRHVLHAMESAGVMVFGLPRSFIGGDAFSVWSLSPTGERNPIVVMSSDRPADRVRHSASHELGHLVMHQPLPARTDVHAEADLFAGAFLIPPEDMRQELPSTTTLETFLQIKLKWGVSVQAAIVRAHRLGLITPRKYSSLFKSLSARGWRLHEPLSAKVPLERPRSFRQIAEMLYGKRLDFQKIADEICYPEPFVRALLEAHAGRDPVQEVRSESPAVRPSSAPLTFKPRIP
ncbi:MAG: XRE family transcriptional regulator [Vicinamibacterales bacterium]